MGHPLIHPEFVANTRPLVADGELRINLGPGFGPYQKALARLLRGVSRLLPFRLR